jgi:hypothetical protein
MNDIQRISNGARAAQIAAEHFSELEQENEKLRITIAELRRDLAIALTRRDDMRAHAGRLEHERGVWQTKAVGVASLVMANAKLMVEAAQEAQEIINMSVQALPQEQRDEQRDDE